MTREQWLNDRSQGIGASESPILFRQGYANTSVYKLWAQKLGLIERDDLDDVESVRWGQRMEPVIIQALREDAGLDVQPALQHEFLRSTERPHMGCTLDARAFNDSRETPGVVQIKNVGSYFASEWADQPPLRVICQVQHEMYVTGYEWGIAAGLVGGNRLKWHPFERHEAFIQTLCKLCDEFWRCVETKTPPEIDGSEATAVAIRRLHPNDNGKAIALHDDEFQNIDDQLADLSKQIKELTAKRDEIENRIKARMGDCTFAGFQSGKWASWRTENGGGYEVKPFTKRVFRVHKRKPDDAPAEIIESEVHQPQE